MIFKHFQFKFSFILTVALLGCSIFASELENSVIGRQDRPSFNRIAIDFLKMVMSKLESGDYVMAPREEIIYIIVLHMIIKRERAKMDKLRKAFMYMRHGRKDGF